MANTGKDWAPITSTSNSAYAQLICSGLKESYDWLEFKIEFDRNSIWAIYWRYLVSPPPPADSEPVEYRLLGFVEYRLLGFVEYRLLGFVEGYEKALADLKED